MEHEINDTLLNYNSMVILPIIFAFIAIEYPFKAHERYVQVLLTILFGIHVFSLGLKLDFIIILLAVDVITIITFYLKYEVNRIY